MPSSINDYVPIRELGTGAQGRVLLIQEKANPENVFACKEIACPSQNILDTAVSEIKSLMRLEHPRIIRYEDFYIVAPTSTNSAFDQAFHDIKVMNNNNNNFLMNRNHNNNIPGRESKSFNHSFFMFGGDHHPHHQQNPNNNATTSRNPNFTFTGHHQHYHNSNKPAPDKKNATKVYLLTEYCDNGDLSHVIRHATDSFFEHGRHPIAESKIIEWLAQCCEALDTIHKKFIHRDIKPTNVFLCSKDDSVKLGDFGLATPIQNQNMSVVGTPSYVAPEQMLHEKPSSAVDVFGLGATFLELVTLQENRQVNINTQLLDRGNAALDQVVNDVVNMKFSRGLASILRDMLQRYPQDRPTPGMILQRLKGNNNSSSRMSPPLFPSTSQQQQQQVPIACSSSSSCPSSNANSRNVTPTTGTNDMVVSSSSSSLCAICKVYKPEIHCPTCSLVLCSACDVLKHRSLKEMQNHVRNRITTSSRNNNNNNNPANSTSLGTTTKLGGGGAIDSHSCDSLGSSFDNNINNQQPRQQQQQQGTSSAISPLDPNFNRESNNNNNLFPRNVAVPNKSQQQQQQQQRSNLPPLATTTHQSNQQDQQQRSTSPFSSSSGSYPLPPSSSQQQQQTRQQHSPSPFSSTALLGSTIHNSTSTTTTANSNNNNNNFIQSILSVYRPTLEVPSIRYPTIAAALKEAPSGSRILVNNNNNTVFSEMLEFPRPDIEIIGNPTTTSSPSSSSSSKPKIEVRGPQSSTAIRISGQEGNKIKLINLSIAQLAPAVGDKQFAVLISDASDVMIENCEIHSDTGSAIGVSGVKCDPLISNCKLSAHLTGIHISGSASGVIQNNFIYNTGLAGVLIKRKAAPQICGNTLENNQQAGIFFFRAGGLAIKNVISGCGGCAFVIKGQGTEPTIRKNDIRNCHQAGFLCSDESRGSISENTIYRVRKTGILIKTSACPTIARNIITRGQEAGIYIFENGAGRIEENEILENENAGIIVTSGGCPFVVSNRIVRNTYEGIWVCNGGKGNFEKNVLEGNGRKGAMDIQEGCQVQWR